jgi:hypothetical protein
MAGGEDYYLVTLVGFFETLNSIGTNVDACFDSFTIRKGHGNFLITGVFFYVIDAMHQCFIQIKYYCLFNMR